MKKIIPYLAIILFLISTVTAGEWQLMYNETFEHGDNTRYVREIHVGGGSSNNFSVDQGTVKEGTYSFGFNDTGSLDHIAFIQNATFQINTTENNYSTRGWWLGNWDNEYGGFSYNMKDLQNFYGTGVGTGGDFVSIWTEIAGSRVLNNGASGSAIEKNTWYWLETFSYTNRSMQGYVYDDKNGNLLASQVLVLPTTLTGGYLGFHGMRTMRVDSVEYYIWAELMTANWDALEPQTNTFHNANFDFNVTLTAVDGTANCTLYRDGSTHSSQNSLTDGTQTFPYTVGSESATYQFHMSCFDTSTTSNTTTKTLRIDTVNPQLMCDVPLIDNTTKVDTSISLNCSVDNDFLNYSYVNITGGGDTYYRLNDTGTPNHYYTETINTTGWAEGNKNLELFGYDQLNNNTLNVAFEVCHAVWSCDGYGTCNVSDQSPCNSVEDTNCGYGSGEYTGDYSEFSPIACNYCDSTWTTTTTQCYNSLQNISYTYTNNCCDDTGLPSDCNIPANQTDADCSLFTYEASDADDILFDILGGIAVTLVGLGALIGIGFAYQRVTGKKVLGKRGGK